MRNTIIQDDSYYRSLTRIMVLIIIFASVTPLVVISGTILYYFEVSYQEKVLDHLKVLIKKHKQNIDNFLTENLNNIRVFAHSHPFEQLSNQSFLERQLAILQQEAGRSFVDLGVINDQGKQIAYAGPFRLGQADYSKAAWFKEAVQKDYYVSEVFSGLRGLPHFIVAARLEHNGVPWIIRATVDFEQFNQLVEKLRVGETGFAFILNNKGEFQTSPRPEVVTAKDAYLDFLKGPAGRAGEVAVAERTDEFGNHTIHVMSRMKDGEWLLGYQQNASDAYSVFYRTRRLALAIFLAGLAGIVAVALVLSKRMVRRISDADRQKEMMNEQVIEAGKLASLGELAAGIAHEINNPVAIMVEEAGWIEDLLKEEDLKQSENLDEFKRAVDQIRLQGKRCKEITFKLLSFARKTDPTVKSVQLNEVVDDVVALSHQRAKYGNIKIITNLAPELPPVNASPSEMQQLLLNLINNSCDALNSKGGTIEITTRLSDKGVVVDVADDGPGIPKANLPRIFDPFFTTKPVGKGTGLGLSICYGIIKKMGGELSVNSAVGIGTTFHVHVPLPADSNEGTRTPESRTPPAA